MSVQHNAKGQAIPAADAVLLTYCDNDHYSRKTCVSANDKM